MNALLIKFYFAAVSLVAIVILTTAMLPFTTPLVDLTIKLLLGQ